MLQTAAATLALPSVPVRLDKSASAYSGNPVARDASQWLVPLAAHPAGFLRCILPGKTPPAGNGQASRAVIALTFPYDATAPPGLRA
ncbi:MAG TPA: hypothetical protein VK529_02510 [Gemmatimonadaceae bacterium]|nr:hypothetical protein [Gemmatimonadaceae bacterium]